MFETGWGFQEIILILIIALIVVGPERLPALAKKAGLWFGKLRRFVTNVKEDVEKEFAADELKRVLKEQADSTGLHDIIEETRGAIDETRNAVDKQQEYLINAIQEDPSQFDDKPAADGETKKIDQTAQTQNKGQGDQTAANTSANAEPNQHADASSSAGTDAQQTPDSTQSNQEQTPSVSSGSQNKS